MIDIKMSELDWYVGEMYMRIVDPDNTIYLGTDLEYAESIWHTYRPRIREVAGSVGAYYHDYVERMINHEVLHIVLLEVAGFKACDKLDNVCLPPHHRISNP